MHLELGGVGEHGQPADCLGSFSGREAAEQGADALSIENALGLLDSQTGRREAEVDAACIGLVTHAENVAGADEAFDGNGHGGERDARVGGET